MIGEKRSIPTITGVEKADIQLQIAADPDDTEATGEQIAQAKHFAEALPVVAAALRAARPYGAA